MGHGHARTLARGIEPVEALATALQIEASQPSLEHIARELDRLTCKEEAPGAQRARLSRGCVLLRNAAPSIVLTVDANDEMYW